MSTRTLDVVSYNIQLLPDFACAFGKRPCKCSSWSCRVTCGKDLRVRLLGQHPELRPHDVIVFQEAFSHSHRDDLAAALEEDYPHRSGMLGRGNWFGLSQDGGVEIVSRWPIVAGGQKTYSNNGYPFPLEECLSNKGVTYAAIDKEGQLFHIFGTHMRAGERGGSLVQQDDASARRAQLREMRRFMNEMLAAARRDDPVIIAGDLNIDRHNASEYQNMLVRLNAVLPEPVVVRDRPGQAVSTTKAGDWIDYVLYRVDYLRPSQVSESVIRPTDARSPYTDGDLSDHFAVLARFVFNLPGPTLR